ncbi:hypothetical protein [Emcibacter sp.]|uniref:hypothetical protein n=1 Tax=Emcibacter sp. TaxID=1979954 RepID=UPI002AA66D1F|nr:hypothetical protein [Emcibacter sp.]
MSEIGGPQKPDFSQQDNPTRVTPTSTTSDQGAQQQSPKGQSAKTEKTADGHKEVQHHDPAVTLSASLLHLQAGSSFIAKVEGRDGEGRPVISTEKGTYVVQAPPENEAALAKLPPESRALIQISAVDKEIVATITPIRTEKHTGLEEKTFQPSEVILTLVNVASNILPGTPGTATVAASANPGFHYQASNLYKAEQIARNISGPLETLPLPTVTQSYTFFETGQNAAAGRIDKNTLAGHTRAPLSSTIISTPVIAQETGAVRTPVQPDKLQKAGLENLLHKPVFATVIKTYPKPDIPLPAFVQKEIALDTPLDDIPRGKGFSLSVLSVAIPNEDIDVPRQDNAPAPEGAAAAPITGPQIQSQPGSAVAAAATAPASSPGQPASTSTVTVEQSAALPTATPPAQAISGIIVDPQKNLHATQASENPAQLQKQPLSKASAYNGPPAAPSDLKTHYLATPVSVVKFESAVELPPGTIVTFSVARPAEQDTAAAAQHPAGQPKHDYTPGMQSPSPGTGPTPAQPATSAAPAPESGFIPLATDLPLAPQPLMEMLDNWESLSLALSALAAQQGVTINAAMGGRLPNLQAPQQMTTGIIFFMAAMGSPNPAQAWLGQDIVQQLQRAGQEKLVQQLDTDMRRIASLRADSPPGDWRPVLLPLQTGPEITAIPMLVRHLGDENKKQDQGGKEDTPADKAKATRFILELDLKGTGNLILDGMLRELRLDIILKTEKFLSGKLQQRLTGLFDNSLRNSGFEGDLVFQDGRKPDFSVKKLIETKIHFSDRTPQKA